MATGDTTVDNHVNKEVNQELQKTELGGYVKNHKKGVIIGVIILFLIVLAVAVTTSLKNSSTDEELSAAYEVEENLYAPYLNDKMTKEEFLPQLENTLSNQAAFHPSLIAQIMQVSSKLTEQGEWEKAKSFLTKAYDRYKGDAYKTYLVGHQLIVVNEQLGDTQSAIEMTKQLIQNNANVMPERLYLTLGRLNLKVGNKEEAKKQFEYLIKTYPNQEEQVKLARLYLGQIQG